MFPGILQSLPCVISGSGGESRHLHFLTDKPFYGRKLAVSEGRHRTANGGWTHDWEVDLFGTGRQVAMPPSIHPITGIAYRWEREYDLDGLEFGGGPIISSDLIEALGIASTAKFEFESREPLTFAPGQLERELDSLSLDVLDDRPKWIMLGQALHHQFGGSQEGFDLWMHYSAKSEGHLKDSSLRAELARYRGFGRNRREPVTMATVRSWYLAERNAANLAFAIAELDDLDDVSRSVETMPASNAEGGEFDELLNAEPTATSSTDESVFDIGLTDTALDWKTLLAISEKGSIEPNLHNLRLIVENDKRTTGVMAFNEFTQEVVQRGAPGVRSPNRKNQAKPFVQLSGPIWTLRDRANGDFWTEEKDDSIRAMIEAPKTQGGYGIKVPDRDLRAAINIVGRKNCFHPVREYLSAQQWDGTPRVDRLFIDYLGAPDDAYGRDIARLMMIAGVARIFEPGCKWDYVVILQGLQGKRKSTFISTLAKSWAAELEGDMTDTRAMVEAMQKAWILDISVQRMADAFANTLTSSIDGFVQALVAGESAFGALKTAFLDFAANFLRLIAQMILQQIALNIAKGVLSAFGFGVPVPVPANHTGGIAGQNTSGSRLMGSDAFAAAARFHTGGIAGLRPDEVPIIAQKGEEILTRGDPRHRANGGADGGGAAPVNLKVINAIDAGDVVSKGLDTGVGGKAFINYIRANSAAVKQALG